MLGRKQLTISKMKNMNTIKSGLLTTALCGIVSLVAPLAHANLVVNGGFETTTSIVPVSPIGTATPGSGQLGYDISVTGWTTGTPDAITAPFAYNFLFASSSTPSTDTGNAADHTPGAQGQYGDLTLYGPGNGNNNGLVNSPNAGNYIGLDADVAYSTALQTTTLSLNAGQKYALSFYWAGAQQTSFSGPTTDTLAVTLGGVTQTTSTIAVPTLGFNGWFQTTFFYTPTTTGTELLSFMASGTPLSPNEPPFVLLDGVDLESFTPDGGLTIALLGGALVGLEGLRRKFFR